MRSAGTRLSRLSSMFRRNCQLKAPKGAAPTRQTMLYKTPKGWSYVSPGWSDVSNTIVAQPWVTGNALTENPEGVSLNGAWSSIPNVSLVSSISIPCRVHNLAEFVDSASLCRATPSGFLFPNSIRYPGLRECSLWLTFAPPWADIGSPLRGFCTTLFGKSESFGKSGSLLSGFAASIGKRMSYSLTSRYVNSSCFL